MSEASEPKHHILIVEDDAWVSRVIQRVFAKAGYQTTVASNGEQAVRAISEQRFDAMITDINMPKMDGRELCQTIFEGDYTLPASILVVTSQTRVETRSWVERFPGVDLQEKPISPKALLRWVESKLAERRDEERRAA